MASGPGSARSCQPPASAGTRPAHGLAASNPTWGRVSPRAAIELGATLDTPGPMCRSAEDAAAMLGAIAGAVPEEPTALRAPAPGCLAGIAELTGLERLEERQRQGRQLSRPELRALQEAPEDGHHGCWK